MMFDSSGVSSLVPWMTAIFDPILQSFMAFASWITNWITPSVPWKVGILNPITPLKAFIYLTACPFTEHARISTCGLYFETSLASFPESVRTTIKVMSYWSRMAEQTAAATASAVPIGGGV